MTENLAAVKQYVQNMIKIYAAARVIADSPIRRDVLGQTLRHWRKLDQLMQHVTVTSEVMEMEKNKKLDEFLDQESRREAQLLNKVVLKANKGRRLNLSSLYDSKAKDEEDNTV